MRRTLTVLPLIVFLASGWLWAETVQGVLLSSTGQGRPSTALVFVNRQTQKVVVADTDDSGKFAVQLPPGEYAVYQGEQTDSALLTLVQIDNRKIAGLELQEAARKNASLEAIGEFVIDWSGPSEIGEQSVTELINPFPAKKRGRFFGSLYEFHRNDNLDARNFFDPVGEPLPEYKRNQFGATLGFLASEKLTLQGSYDGLRIHQGSTLLSHIPTRAMKSGDFSELDFELIDPLTGQPFSGNQIPESRINPVSRRLLSILPDPNRDDPDRNFVNNDPRIRDQNYFHFRLDYATESNSSWTAEYHYTGVGQNIAHRIPAFNSVRDDRHQEFSISYNRALTERLLTYARVEFNRNRSFGLSRNSGQEGLLDSLGIEGLEVTDPIEEGLPEFDLTSYTDFGDDNSPATSVRNRLSVDSSFTYVHGDHTLRWGVELGGRQLNDYRSDGLRRGIFSFSGSYTGDAFADLLLGFPDAASRGIGSDRADLRRKRIELFLRDQWKVTPKLDFSFGVTYRYFQPYHSTHDNVAGFFPLLFEPPESGEIVLEGTPRADELGFGGATDGSLIFPDKNDWSPSLGLAYSPLGSNRLVIRGSYSIWYDPPNEWTYLQSLTRNYPFYYVETAEASPVVPEIGLESPFTAKVEPELTFRGISPHLKSAYVHYWQLSVENEIARNLNVEIRYAGRKGTNATRRIPANVPLPGEGSLQERRPNTRFGRFQIINSGGSFSGHALDLTAEKRLSGGFSFRSGFEWNRFIDDSFREDPQNPRDLRQERASASWVAKRRFFLNYIVDLPLRSFQPFENADGWLEWMVDGWRLSGITEIQDGRPFTVSVSGDPNNDGVYGDRPDRIDSGVLDPEAQTVDHWFDTTAFVPADPNGFGSSGRNILLGPGHQAWDISVIKQTRFSDGDMLEFRVEFFNAFNQVNFDRPNAQLDSTNFGKIFGADRAREIEVALKYSF